MLQYFFKVEGTAKILLFAMFVLQIVLVGLFVYLIFTERPVDIHFDVLQLKEACNAIQ